MYKRNLILLLSLLVFAACDNPSRTKHSDKLESALEELDDVISRRASYENVKLQHIAKLKQMMVAEDIGDEQRYEIGKSLYEELFAYQFDEAHKCLQDNLEVARRLKDRQKINEMLIKMGYLYASAGMYSDSSDILENKVDTTRFNDKLRLEYYSAQQKLNNELINFSKTSAVISSAIGKARYYTDRLLAELPKESFEYRSLYVVNALSQHRLDDAEQMCLLIIETSPDSSREFAVAAYLEAVLCIMTNRGDEMAYWYARSATADIRSVTRDNASIYCLSTYLFDCQDVMRALQYVQIAMSDASFYNAKLRQWQIGSYLTTIELSAQEIESRRVRQLSISMVALGLLMLCLCLVLMHMFKLYRLTRRNKQIVREQNERLSQFVLQLKGLNMQVIEANRVKEEYIGLFLSMCSSYIDKLSNYERSVRRKISRGQIKQLEAEIANANIAEEEQKIFYETFDNAFLHLYPTFVDDFNSLLVEEERIIPPRPEQLTTELRIFALIRLGIVDSSRIAAMLHYSVNTIYNYRAKVKSKAKIERGDFEDAVRHIGSFSAK